MEQPQQTADQVLGQVQETVAQLVDQVQEQASRAQSFLERHLEENPLLLGAVAPVLGGVTLRPNCNFMQALEGELDTTHV